MTEHTLKERVDSALGKDDSSEIRSLLTEQQTLIEQLEQKKSKLFDLASSLIDKYKSDQNIEAFSFVKGLSEAVAIMEGWNDQ
jgi:hypothetical protein